MSGYHDALIEGRIESWGPIEVRTEVSFCSRCTHPLAAGVCVSCGWTHCPICGAAAGCDHALPEVECREASAPNAEGGEDHEDEEDDCSLEDPDYGARVDLPFELPNPPTHLVGITGAEFLARIDSEQSPGPGLTFRALPEPVRWHGGWTEGIPAPLRDAGILYELIHDRRLPSRLEEEVWTRATRSAGRGLVAVERIPLGVLSRQLHRKRLWFSDDRDAVLEAGRALEADWERRIAEIEDLVRSRVKYPECPLCGTTTYHTYEDGLLSCGECGAWECPYCGVNDVECGSGCSHSLGLIVEGSLYDSQVDLSAIPASELSWEKFTEIDEARTEEVFGDLCPVLDVYDYDPTSRPNRAYLMLALVEHACPDVHVEFFCSPHGSLEVPLCHDIELGKRQFESALARLADAMRRFDALASGTPHEIEEEN